MNYAIIGFGPIGKALANAFARKGIEAVVATRRSPDRLSEEVEALGVGISAKSLAAATEADTIFLAIPFASYADVAKLRPDWNGKTVVDVMNAYGVPVEELKGRPSSAIVAEAFSGARLVKAFNHLPARKLVADPDVQGGRRVIFVSSDDDAAADDVGALAERLGYAPVKLGPLAQGGALVQARGTDWAPLIFQDLVKFAS